MAFARIDCAFQIAWGLGPTAAGIRTIPVMGAAVITSITTGLSISRSGKYVHYPIIGTLLFSLGVALMRVAEPTTNYGVLFVFMILAGCGLGMVNGPLTIVAQNVLNKETLV